MLVWGTFGTQLSPARGPKHIAKPPGRDELWKLDVRALGYSPPVNREGGPFPLPAVGTVCFLHDQLVVTFITRTVSAPLPHRGETDTLPLHLHALFIDSMTGQLRATREWPTASDRSRIAPASQGNFVVITPDRLILYSPEIMLLKEVALSLSREAMLVSFSAEVSSPDARNLLITYDLPNGEIRWYKWFDLDNLQHIKDWFSDGSEWTFGISDSGMAIEFGIGGTRIGAPGNPTNWLCPPTDEYCFNSTFVSDNTLFGWSSGNRSRGSMGLRVMLTDGRVLSEQMLPRGEVIQPFHPSVGGRQFAIAVYQGRGGNERELYT